MLFLKTSTKEGGNISSNSVLLAILMTYAGFLFSIKTVAPPHDVEMWNARENSNLLLRHAVADLRRMRFLQNYYIVEIGTPHDSKLLRTIIGETGSSGMDMTEYENYVVLQHTAFLNDLYFLCFQ